MLNTSLNIILLRYLIEHTFDEKCTYFTIISKHEEFNLFLNKLTRHNSSQKKERNQ